MSPWTESDSAIYRELADVAVPRRAEMLRAIVTVAPFAPDDVLRVVDLGAGTGELSAAILDAFPKARVTALDGSASMRAAATARLTSYGDRASVRGFDLASLDWWDVMFGAHLVVSSLCLHHLNDAKKQYLYKAAADRMAPGGAFLVADLVQPAHEAARGAAAREWDEHARLQAEALARPELYARFVAERWNHFRFPDEDDRPAPLLHHLIWMRHAGLTSVDAFWLCAGHAVFGGFKPAEGSAAPLQAGS